MKKALLITAIITIISYSASAQAAVKIASPISNLYSEVQKFVWG